MFNWLLNIFRKKPTASSSKNIASIRVMDEDKFIREVVSQAFNSNSIVFKQIRDNSIEFKSKIKK